MPSLPERTLHYADARPELTGMTPGEVVIALEQTETFKTTVRPMLDRIDAIRLGPDADGRQKRGYRPAYGALDYFRMQALKRAGGYRAISETRDFLAGDRAPETRRLLGFESARARHGGKVQKTRPGVPSEGWVSTFGKKWLTEETLDTMFRALYEGTRQEVFANVPGIDEELRVLFVDGSKCETHFTAPKRNKKGKVTNAGAITAPDAGYVPYQGKNLDHSGSGWNVIFAMTARGIIVDKRVVPLNASETDTFCDMVPALGSILDSAPGPRQLRVLSTDGAFNKPETRRRLREIGVLENTHLSSHATKPSARRSAAARYSKHYAIQGHPNWHANGHRELGCKCGAAKFSRQVELSSKGKVISRVKGECRECGTITITSGRWRLSNNPDRFVPVLPGQQDKADYGFGNPLTFNDGQAAKYGNARFNGQEGAFGSQLAQRFNLLKGKRWFRRQRQLEIDVNAVAAIANALTLERYRRQQAPIANAAPPPPSRPVLARAA